jgi:hypothetical protein
LETIERAQVREGIDCIRLQRNLCGLIASAAAAAAAVRAVNVVHADRAAPARVRRWLQRAIQNPNEDAECHSATTSPANWIFDSSESLIESVCQDLSSAGFRLATFLSGVQSAAASAGDAPRLR